MELTAVIQGLRALPVGSVVQVRPDSTYVINGATQWMRAWHKRGWKTVAGKPVLNEDLWRELEQAMSIHEHVGFEKVKGHSGVVLNERCDRLAAQAALAAAAAMGTA